MDWEQFCFKTQKIIAKGRLSCQEIDVLLLSFGISVKATRRFFSHSIPFPKMRIGFLYEKSFLELKKQCVDGPYKVKKAYNSLVNAIFSPAKAYFLQFDIPKEEPKKRVPPDVLLDSFESKMRAVHSTLFQNFVSAFKSETLALVQKTLSNSELEERLTLQEKNLLFLDGKIREAEKIYRKNASIFAQEFYTVGLGAFRDLAASFDTLWKGGFDSPLVASGLLDEKKKEEVLQAIQKGLSEKKEQLAFIIEVGKGRLTLLQEISIFDQKARQALQRLKYYKDGHQEFESISKQMAAFVVTKDSFFGMAQDKVEQKMKDVEQAFRSFEKEAPRLFANVMAHSLLFEQTFSDITRTLKRRLYEFFSCVTPFPDLTELLNSKREFIIAELQEAHGLFFSGSLSTQEYEERCFALTYEHDIKQLRYDLSFRATRLTETRKTLYDVLKETSKLYRYSMIIQEAAPFRQDLMALKEELEHYLAYIENPYIVFQSASSYVFESINEVFRKLWIELEGFQAKLILLQQKCLPVLKNNSEQLLRPFYRVVDTLESVLKTPDGKRPQILVPLQSDLEPLKGELLFQALDEKIKELQTRFPFLTPFAFFMKLTDQSFRFELLQKEKALYEHMEKVRLFAKNLQAFKMFEEGRVDEFLQLFERFGIIEEDGRQDLDAALRHAERIENASFVVVEEALLEMGFVDRKALRDIREKELQKGLFTAIEKAKHHAEELIKKRLPDGALQKRLSSIAHKKVQEDASLDDLLTYLRQFCHFFFEVRLARLTQKGNISAFAEHFISETRSFINDVESLLQKKVGLDPVFGPPIIDEVFEAKKIVEKLELAKEAKEAFEPILKDIFSVLSKPVSRLADQDKQLIEKRKQALVATLEKLSSLKKETAFEWPLYCTPGMLSIK